MLRLQSQLQRCLAWFQLSLCIKVKKVVCCLKKNRKEFACRGKTHRCDEGGKKIMQKLLVWSKFNKRCEQLWIVIIEINQYDYILSNDWARKVTKTLKEMHICCITRTTNKGWSKVAQSTYYTWANWLHMCVHKTHNYKSDDFTLTQTNDGIH